MYRLLFTAALLALLQVSALAQGPAGLKVGEKAPDFTARNHEGKPFTLSAALAQGPVVLVFYRGEWCPFCNRQLKALESRLAELQAAGAQVVAVSPESVENVAKSVRLTRASFPVLHDDGGRIMEAYGVRQQLDAPTVAKLKSYGVDLATANAENGETLPVPATYVIDRAGVVRYVHFDPDYRQRPDPAELLRVVQAL